MRKLSCLGFTIALSVVLAACGSSGGDDSSGGDGGAKDGSVIKLDGGAKDGGGSADAAVVHPGMCNMASTGTTAHFDTCTQDSDCLAGSECLALNTTKLCFPCCDGTGTTAKGDDCDVGTACVQNGAPTLSATARSLENHCFFSFCGPTRGNGAGTRGSICSVGGDLWMTGTTGLPMGQCLPFDDSTMDGECLNVGTIAAGAACPFTGATSAPAQQCAIGSLCIGQQGAAMGTCAPLCDPLAAAGATGSCATGSACQDSSEVDSTGAVGSYGFCIAGKKACSVFTDAADCAGQTTTLGTNTTDPAKCSVTSAAHGLGLCGFPTGTATLGGACNPNPMTTSPATAFCPIATFCGNDDSGTGTATTAKCNSWCDGPGIPGAPTTALHPCAAGGTCSKYIFDNGVNGEIDGQGFGVCETGTPPTP